MPIYEYIAESAAGCAHCTHGFDALQKIADAPLTQCPHCGGAVRRKLSAPSVAIGGAHLVTEKHAAKHGFTQYRRAGGGVYEKTAGEGPKYISGD